MKRIFLFLFLLSNNIEAQTWFAGWDTVPAKFRLDLSPFQFGGGPWNINTKTDLNEQSSFILTNSNRVFSGFQMDIQAIFKDKIGIETGFDFVGSSINEKKIRNEFQNHIPDYQVNFAANNNQTGESPFYVGYEYRIYKMGLLGFIPCKKFVFIPYTDFLYTIESQYPSVKVDFADQLNGSSFTRKYMFYNTHSNGFKLGASIRGYFKNKNRKHSQLYMQFRAEFVYLKINGYGFYIDKFIDNNEIKSSTNNFSQHAYAFVLGFTLGGLDLHW